MRDAKTAWEPYKPTGENPWDRRKVGHLYRRAGFGATAAELDAGVKDGPEKTLARILEGGRDSEDFNQTSEFMASERSMPSPTPLALGTLAWVFLAGGVGATLRVILGGLVDARLSARLPFAGTLVVNLIGCFVIGVVAVVLPAGTLRTAVVAGLLGGFTTYSAFALFSYELLRDERLGVLALQIGLHVVLGVVCVAAGMALGRMVVPGAGMGS